MGQKRISREGESVGMMLSLVQTMSIHFVPDVYLFIWILDAFGLECSWQFMSSRRIMFQCRQKGTGTDYTK
jgi:hypothetical protein